MSCRLSAIAPSEASGGFRLLYVGIAPGRASASAKPQTLRGRIRTHASGNADASTLRFTLGSLLGPAIGVSLERTRSNRLRFGAGERLLSDWMDRHARVAWISVEAPWQIERAVVRGLELPLNRAHNAAHPFYATLGASRAAARAAADERAATLAARIRP